MKTLKTSSISLFFTVLIFSFLLHSGSITAQPAAGQLADRVDQINTERISQVDRVTITTEMVAGAMQGMETTHTYEKVMRDGKPVLELVEDGEFESVEFTGQFDKMMGEMIRHSSSIGSEQLRGHQVYRIEVDDAAFLQQIAEMDLLEEEMDEYDATPEKVIFWLDSNDYIVHQIHVMQQLADGSSLEMHITLEDYQEHRGLPMAHTVYFEIKGLEQMFSDDEMEEARRGMSELREQLEQMPAAQRQMIEEQLRPQIEQFEQMMEQGEMGQMEIRITNVEVE